MTIILTAGFLALLGATLEAQTGYFPLEVGNRWIYSDGADTHELAITDTVRIAPDFHRGMWTAELSPSGSEGRLYFLLEGEEILRRIGLIPSPYDEDAYNEDDEETWDPRWPLLWSPFDAMLVREAGTLDAVYADWERTRDIHGYLSGISSSVRQYGPQDLIVAGGARDATDGRWLLFEKDVPYWYLFPTEYRSFDIKGLEVGGGVEFWYDFRSEPGKGSLTVGATIGGRQYFTDSQATYHMESSELYSCGLVFKEGIGITRIAGKWTAVLDLVDLTRGSETHVRPVSWGRLKKEMWER